MAKTFNGATFRKMILAGASILEDNKKFVDSLNVFPVPDGDTGTNMALTLKNAVKEVTNCPTNEMSDLCDAFTKGALKGARGNSGVILSQIIKGLCSALSETKDVNVKTLAKGFEKGAEIAYKAVTVPKEGTILTVIRMMAEHSTKISKKAVELEDFFRQVLDKGEETLKLTPELLPVLKKAGVVDSGGQGLIIIFTGFYKVLIGDETLQITMEENKPLAEFGNNDYEVNLANLADIEFAYCTEFMIIEMKKKTTEADIDKLREKLMEIGDSVICIGDLSLVKVHVHTNQPNLALGYAIELGELYNLKIENMLEQNRELKRDKEKSEQAKTFGIVAVSAGDGLNDIFKDLNVDYVIKGGQTMNPSAEDILKAIEKVNATNIFVLPNNKNIILAAEQAKDLTNKNVIVIPTKNVPEGISSALSFNPEGTIEENTECMTASIETISSCSVTYAVRTTNVDGFDLTEGDIIGLNEKSILAKSDNVGDAVIDSIEKIMKDDYVNISLYYGSDIKEEETQILVERLQAKYPDSEITCLYGGQPVYYYIISLE